MKVGFDPTAPDLHVGHTVLLRKMKHFQDLGHRVIFLIGDFTGLIGDPTGRNKTRPPLSREDILKNAETYKKQVFKILDPVKTVVDFNSRWLGAMSSEDWIRLAPSTRWRACWSATISPSGWTTTSRSRSTNFCTRWPRPMTAWRWKPTSNWAEPTRSSTCSSAATSSANIGLEPQVLLMTPILEGLDGVEKMSKSLGNYIGIAERPRRYYGKIMSITDKLMWRYYELLTDLSYGEIEKLRQDVENEVTATPWTPKRILPSG